MPHWHPSSCRACGRHKSQAGPISGTGLCQPCGLERMEENLEQLVAHNGPRFTHWRQRLAASLGAIPLDVLKQLEADAKG